MSYPEPRFARARRTNPITFCSCIPCRTELEQIPTQREVRIMWMKDAAAGAGLIIFMVSSFALAGGASSLLNLL